MSIFHRPSEPHETTTNPLTEAELGVIDRFAALVVKWDMTTPAILLLESVKPMNYISSQLLVFAEPIVQSVFNFRDYETFREALEKRQSIEETLQRIEARDALALKRRRAIRKHYKSQRKTWTFVQRWVGIGRPRLEMPEEIKQMPDGFSDALTKKPSGEQSDSSKA
jgi:hypothetical protein